MGPSGPKLKPYQLKPKRGKETFMEPPMKQKELPSSDPQVPTSGDPKKLKRIKKKLDELNRKIRHSRKKHDGLIHKRNSLRKTIEAVKHDTKLEPMPEPEWNFKELEQAFRGAYRSYRVEGAPKMDADTFFSQIRKGLIDLIKWELKTRTSARIQTATWIKFSKDEDRVDLAFNSLMMSIYRGSDLDQIVDGMIAHMKTQIENPALLNSRFVFDKILHLDVNFHQLNLMRGSSYLSLPNYIVSRKAVIDPQNEDKKGFMWAAIAVDRWMEIKSHPERISNLRKFVDNYDWSGLEFPVSLKQIGKVEENNNISVNVLGSEGKDIDILRKGGGRTHNWGSCGSHREINLLMISEYGINHYTEIKSLSRLLRSSNTKHSHKQFFV